MGKGTPLPEESGTVKDVSIAGKNGKSYNQDGKVVILWDNGETRLRIQSSKVSADALLKIAESLEPMK